MAYKFVALFALVAAASAIEYHHHHYQPAPLLIKKVVVPHYHHEHEEEKYAPAEYHFNYEVHDEHTGDIKSHEESRHGDNVQGKYTLIDADGYRRIVEYTADDHHGFNAVVHREPVKGYHAPQEHKQISAPVVKHDTAPIVHKHDDAPVAKIVEPIAHDTPQKHTEQPKRHIIGGYHASSHVSFSGPASNYHY